MQLSLISSNQDMGTHFSFVFLKTINTSLIKAGCSRAVTQQGSSATPFAKVAALLVKTTHQQSQDLPPDSPSLAQRAPPKGF